MCANLTCNKYLTDKLKFLIFFPNVSKLGTDLKQKVWNSYLQVLILTINFFILVLGVVWELTNALSVTRK